MVLVPLSVTVIWLAVPCMFNVPVSPFRLITSPEPPPVPPLSFAQMSWPLELVVNFPPLSKVLQLYPLNVTVPELVIPAADWIAPLELTWN
jgi:hypothetical protein